MTVRLQLRRDTATNWTNEDPVLLAGELAVETDTGKFKVGDGTTIWTSLGYSSGVSGADGATILTGSADPTTEGEDGDLFLNTTSYDLFKKVSGSWGTAIANLKGADGATGASGQGVASGGTAGQLLSKVDGTDYNTAWTNQTKSIAFFVGGDLEVKTGLISVIAPTAMTITEIRLAVGTAPTDADLIVDINKNGTTIYTTQANRPTITASGTSATATDPDVTSLALGDILSLDVDQIGSTIAGADLSVIVICEV